MNGFVGGRAIARRARDKVDEKLGRCPRCFTLALLGAVLGWLFVATLAVFGLPSLVVSIASLWPVSFTALWFAHLGTYAARTLAHVKRDAGEPVGVPPYALSRRAAVRLIGGSVRYAAAVSIAGLVAAACEQPYSPTKNDQQRSISCPCRSPKNVYNASFYSGGRAYPAGCYDRCYSTDCRTYNSC